jgi:hypothetical protein
MNPKQTAVKASSQVQMRDQQIMTADVFYADAEVNTKTKKSDFSAQVDLLEGAQIHVEHGEDEVYQRPSKSKASEVNWDKLAEWLEMKYPLIKQMIDANNERGTFANYEVRWDEEREDIVEQYAMRTDFDFKDANIAVQKALNKVRESEAKGATVERDEGFDDWGDGQSKPKETEKPAAGEFVKGLDNDYQAVSLSWNVNGTSIAIAYGKTNHTTWCEHCSVVSIFSVFRRDFNPKKATLNIEVSNCVSEVCFHPTDPLILAGGTVNGEIYLWNIDSEEPQICVSAIDEYFHREAITKLIWVRQENLNLQVNTSLVSTSTDGKILVWRFEDKLRYPIKGYMLAKKKGNDVSVTGGTALDKVNL